MQRVNSLCIPFSHQAKGVFKMFEITKNHQDAYEYYINERMAYPGGDYDFTFEDRFLIYHAPLRHQTVYIAIDMKTGLSVEICSRKNGVYMEHEYTELIHMFPISTQTM